MIRVLSFFGLIGLFLLVSPVLRGYVARGLILFGDVLRNNSPYSYAIAALGLFALLVFSLNRGAQPR